MGNLAAFARGDKELAKQLSNQGKQQGEMMDVANKKAAGLLVRTNNVVDGKEDLHKMDLHGLHVKEALDLVASRIKLLRRRTALEGARPQLVIVTGQGNHSPDGIAKLKPAVEALIARERLRCTVDKPNAGCILVEFDVDSDKAPPPPPGSSPCAIM